MGTMSLDVVLFFFDVCNISAAVTFVGCVKMLATEINIWLLFRIFRAFW